MCCSEKLFRTMTDLVISEGYAAVGYEYINVDDCWLDFARSYDGRLQPDAKRFPRGMADLSEYVSTVGVLHVWRKKIQIQPHHCLRISTQYSTDSITVSKIRESKLICGRIVPWKDSGYFYFTVSRM